MFNVGTATGLIHFQMVDDKLMPELDILTSKTECFCAQPVCHWQEQIFSRMNNRKEAS
jgi:hypothetical protein